jgi:hypothetical protein
MKMHCVPDAEVDRELTAAWMVLNWPFPGDFFTVRHPLGAVVRLAARAAVMKFKVARNFMVIAKPKELKQASNEYSIW